MPIIRSQLKTQFPHATLHPIRPENAVAIGCAIQGAVIDNKITDLAALDVITLSLGIELVEGLFEKVVDRNTSNSDPEDGVLHDNSGLRY